MKTLHVAPGSSAGGSLLRALREAGRDYDVLSCGDDLNCGPIGSNDLAERAEWWGQFNDDPDIEAVLRGFWDRVSATDDRLVVWFGRHAASELAFFHAWADRLGDRPYEYIDVTGRQLPAKRRDGSYELKPMQSVAQINPDGLRSLFDGEQPASTEFKEESSRVWRRLRAENAPFRVVTAEGLVSAPADYFDALILERANTAWRRVARVVGDTMGYNFEPFIQVGDLMLLTRVVALIGQGKLLADGDPWDMRSCNVRLPV
jgi:hypothetical protein